MNTITEIKNAVCALSEDELPTFSSWFEAYEDGRWDRQIERDQESGPLRDLMEKACAYFEAGRCRRL
jgi:hypothetical protein